MKPTHTQPPVYQAAHSFEHSFYDSHETYVHPTAIVGPHVVLSDGVKIGPYAVVTGNVTIGSQTQIHAHAIVGSPAQDVGVTTPLGRVEIGSNTIIREFATINAPKTAEGVTKIGDSCYCMHFSHIAHDVVLENHVVLTNNTQIAGHAHLESHVIMMAHTGVHQWVRVGQYSALTPYTGARQDIPPFSLFVGKPAAWAGLNRIALRRAGFASSSIDAIKTLLTWFYRDKVPTPALVERCATQSWHNDPAIVQVINFITQSTRGVSRQHLKD